MFSSWALGKLNLGSNRWNGQLNVEASPFGESVLRVGDGTISATLGFVKTLGSIIAAPVVALTAAIGDETECRPEIVERHIFVSFAYENEADGQKVIKVLLDHGMRIYRRGDVDRDINRDINWGVDRAAALIVLCSKEYERSKECSKILNYGRQRKVPLVHVLLDVSFRPAPWLEALLSGSRDLSASDCFYNTEEVLLALKEVCPEPFSSLIRRFHEGHIEELAPESEEEVLFEGGCVTGTYTENQAQFSMTIEYFALRNGRVIGHGEDESGIFTICGVYERGPQKVSWTKQYVLGSLVQYAGQYRCEQDAICLDGEWCRSEQTTQNLFSLKLMCERIISSGEGAGATHSIVGHSKDSALARFSLSPHKAVMGILNFRDQGKQVTVTSKLGFVRTFGPLFFRAGNSDVRRHVLVSFALENKADGKKLLSLLSKNGIRVYPRDDEVRNFDQDMSWGVEQAAALIVLCSKEYQCSKDCSKLLNYAHQRKVPLIHVYLDPSSRPTSWLAALLISSRALDTIADGEGVVKVLREVCQLPMTTLIRRFHEGHLEDTGPTTSNDVLFRGGSVSGSYTKGHERYTMNLDYFTMTNGRVIGRGEDDMGAFTICGAYDEVQRMVTWEKSYIGGSLISYSGQYNSEKEVICVKGTWGPSGQQGIDEFTLKMMQEVKKDKVELQGRWARQMPTGFASNMRSQMQRATVTEDPPVLILYEKTQHSIANRICYALNASGIQAICPSFDVNEMMYEIASFLSPVCPILSSEFYKSVDCEKLLTFAYYSGVAIIPISVSEEFKIKTWLVDICEGKSIAWVDEMADESIFKTQIAALVSELGQRLIVQEIVTRNIVFKGTEVRGYYQQEGCRLSLFFPFFSLVNGVVGGHGNDMIGAFIVIGSYSDDEIEFRIQYLRKGCIDYVGSFEKKLNIVTVTGTWNVEAQEGIFQFDLPLEECASRQRRHVMLSYERQHWQQVTQVAEYLKSKGIKVWLNAECTGNSVDKTMAVGVKDAAVVVCFASNSYLNSVKCKKELTYANQMCRPIVLVRLDDVDLQGDNWLGTMVRSLDLRPIDSRPEKAVGALEVLHARIKGKVPNDLNNSVQLHEDVVFDGGYVSGFYVYNAMKCTMQFKYLTIRDGHVVGHGDDVVGPFIIAGTYTDDMDVTFVKQYVGRHQVMYSARLNLDKNGSITINGTWRLGSHEEEFSLYGDGPAA